MVFRMLLLPVSPLLSASALLLDLNLRVTSHWQGESKCLGAFAKLRKGTLSFVMSVRPYVRLYNLAPPPTGWIIMNVIFEYFSKICWGKNSSLFKIRQQWRVLYMYMCDSMWQYVTVCDGMWRYVTVCDGMWQYVTVSRSFLLVMKNISEESCRDNQNTHFVFNNFFPTIVPFLR